jgi:hypothetical protein
MKFAIFSIRTTLALSLSIALISALAWAGLTAPPAHGNAGMPGSPEAVHTEQANGPGPGITPSSGPPGTSITVRGSGFRSFTTVESITLGGAEILGSRTVHTDDRGDFEVSGLIVPNLDPGIRSLVVRVGTGELETTASGTFEVTGAVEVGPESPVAQALEPLGDSLERVFYFNNDTKTWAFYDPRPEFADANTLEQLAEGQVYWFRVNQDITATLNGQERRLTCVNPGTPQEDCWNLLVW